MSSTQPLHELFRKTGFLHVPLDRLFLRILSSPEEKVFIHTQTLINCQKCFKNTSQGTKKPSNKTSKKKPKKRRHSRSAIINRSYFIRTEILLTAALAQCTLSHNATLQKKHYLPFPFHFQGNENSTNSFKLFIVHHTIAACLLTGISELLDLRLHCLPKASSCNDVSFHCNPTAHTRVTHRTWPVICPGTCCITYR